MRSDAFREDVGPADARNGITPTRVADCLPRTRGTIQMRAGCGGGCSGRPAQHVRVLRSYPRPLFCIVVSDNLSARIGAGLGYKAPTVFLEPSEERAFRNVSPAFID